MSKELYVHVFNPNTKEFCVIKSEAIAKETSDGTLYDLPIELFDDSKFHIVIFDKKIDCEVLRIGTVSGNALAFVSLSDDVDKSKAAFIHYIHKQHWLQTTKIQRNISQLNDELKTLEDQCDKETDAFIASVSTYQSKQYELENELEVE